MTVSKKIFDVINDHTHRTWKIDGRLTQPTHEDVTRLVRAMIEDLNKQGYDSIESGGILVKHDGNMIDVYVHVGEFDEDSSI